MLNDILLAFFFGMPAIVAVLHAPNMRAPLARGLLRWGGLAAVVCATLTILPMLACDGTIYDSYANCTGGASLTNLFNTAQPAILALAKIYILAGLPLAILAFVIEWLAPKPRQTP
ncbi:hypothetical protein E7681_14425 [Thalassobius vesicularis]|uniref:Uncharacterized protein n=1 Tax=Thalassobius vesicularis TaxID=1294297 RepID=A0A4S3M6D3_9RHOB|nr:hypothetical protein [Thalassobius vesicularis]THD72620.1 hypothetical protein E7681_14425 [Thalassobius vesicularis]